MPVTGKNFVGFTRSAKGNNRLQATDPSTGKTLPETFFAASDEEIEQTMLLAQKAYAEYRRLDGSTKSRFLNAIADEILALGDELVERAVLETALPPIRIQSERGRTVGQLRMFADLINEGSWCEATIVTADADRQPLPRPDIRRMLMPMGPVAVFAASNFPLAFSTAGGDTASALAGGNPVIVKAHSSHMGTSELVASAISAAGQKTGMPDGVFSMLFGEGQTVGKAMINHSVVKSAAFTGSEAAGRKLFDIASQRPEPIPFFAEMGSLNPVLLLPQALRRRGKDIAKDYAASITLGSGQFCTKPGLLIAMNGKELDAFINDLSGYMTKILPMSMLNPKIHTNFLSNRRKALEQAGVHRISVSTIDPDPAANQGQPTLAAVAAGDFIANPILQEEVFGPYTLLVCCDNRDQLSDVIQSVGGQLTATVVAEEDELVEHLSIVEMLIEKSGRMICNGIPTGVEVCAAMQHGGPYPASSDSRFTSVGTAAIKRFVRPVGFQSWPQSLLPDELRDSNPLSIWRLVDGELTRN
ncbi:MAG: aldehyde dehydrogenase (NADP(+)) [Deltaproteobacteria bacterium]|nr:aldehyde dehydrogenase (NADP(+)) [Deltaproteobacteria bacterium]